MVHAPWKRDQIKRILYNRQYIGEWKRTIDGKKKIFPCPKIIDARLSVEKNNEETIQTQIEMLHQYVREHGEYQLVDTYVDNGY